MVTSTPHPHRDRPHHRLQQIVSGVGLATVAVVLVPHLLPMLGIGAEQASLIGNLCYPSGADAASTGIAGAVSNLLSNVPLIGAEIAKGGFATALASGAIGIGGALLGQYVSKREDGTTNIKWGNIIRTAAFVTSAFVSIPALFPAIAMGVSFIGSMGLQGAYNLSAATGLNVFSGEALVAATNSFITGVAGVLGTVANSASGAVIGLGATSNLWPHLLTCGSVLGSLKLGFGAGKAEPASERSAVSHAEHPGVARAKLEEPRGWVSRMASAGEAHQQGLSR